MVKCEYEDGVPGRFTFSQYGKTLYHIYFRLSMLPLPKMGEKPVFLFSGFSFFPVPAFQRHTGRQNPAKKDNSAFCAKLSFYFYTSYTIMQFYTRAENAIRIVPRFHVAVLPGVPYSRSKSICSCRKNCFAMGAASRSSLIISCTWAKVAHILLQVSPGWSRTASSGTAFTSI